MKSPGGVGALRSALKRGGMDAQRETPAPGAAVADSSLPAERPDARGSDRLAPPAAIGLESRGKAKKWFL